MEKFANNAKSTISPGISDSATSIVVATGSVFPSPTDGDYFWATLDDGTNIEIVKVTARSSNTMTVVRAQQGTSAQAFSTGTRFELRLTKQTLEDLQTSSSGVLVGSSLGAAGSAGSLTFLTGDDHLYIDDGALWRPIDTPGWPRRDGADDTEWEGTNADPPSGWAWQTQDSWAVDVNNARKSTVQFTRSSATGNFTTIYRSATLTTTNKTIYGHLTVLSTGGISANNGRAGILIRNSSNGRAVCFYAQIENIAISLRVLDLTDAVTGTNTATISNNVWTLNAPFVLAIENDGTNLNFKIAPFSGGDESDFQTVFSETLASFLTASGGAADQYGYIMNLNTGSQTLKIISDWIRII